MTEEITPFLKLKKEIMLECAGEWYVQSDKLKELTNGTELMPLYFRKVGWREIFHDSPAIGCMEHGKWDKCVHGPFINRTEAEQATKTENVLNSYKYKDYDICTKIMTRYYPAANFPPKL